MTINKQKSIITGSLVLLFFAYFINYKFNKNKNLTYLEIKTYQTIEEPRNTPKDIDLKANRIARKISSLDKTINKNKLDKFVF